MKQIVLIVMSLLSMGCSLNGQNKKAEGASSDKRILVAYFSCTGNTERVAMSIAEATEGRLYRISPAVAYTSADLNWNNSKSRSSIEMADEQSRPALGGEMLDIEDYDIVFLGYPIWWDLCPRLVNTFLEEYDFAGKTVIPFATSGSSSINNSVRVLKRLYPAIVWKDGRLCNGDSKQAGSWAKQTIRSK